MVVTNNVKKFGLLKKRDYADIEINKTLDKIKFLLV